MVENEQSDSWEKLGCEFKRLFRKQRKIFELSKEVGGLQSAAELLAIFSMDETIESKRKFEASVCCFSSSNTLLLNEREIERLV